MTHSIDSNMSTDTYTITLDDSILTSSTNLTYDYSNIVWTTSSTDLNGATLEVQGDANFHGDLKIQGKSIVDSLEKIEERLVILRPNLELEEKWENLRGLRKAYMELEAEIKEKELIWATLKK